MLARTKRKKREAPIPFKDLISSKFLNTNEKRQDLSNSKDNIH